MIDYKPVARNLFFHQELFWIIFVITGILWLINNMLYRKRFIKNVKSPNIYIFEYESHSGHIFSLYNILNFTTNIFINTLLISALSYYYNIAFEKNILFDQKLFIRLLSIVAIFVLLKKIISFIYLFISKKNNFFSKITFIRRSVEVYKNFYWYLFAFLIWFFPVKNRLIFFVFLSISISWYLLTQLKSYHNFTKHTDIKSYQLFLYLCLSEILPFIILIWWISFQIL